jgi:hypothetical protein
MFMSATFGIDRVRAIDLTSTKTLIEHIGRSLFAESDLGHQVRSTSHQSSFGGWDANSTMLFCRHGFVGTDLSA